MSPEPSLYVICNLGFLGVSLVLYCLFAGADFGAGILECLSPQRWRSQERALVTHAIAPVWEANHVWIVLVVVILFNGFPPAYSQLSTTFHIPITLMLIGIVLRGCAFTFRHYDAVRDGSQRYYNAVFAWSSLLSPWFLGVIAGGLTRGASPPVGASFYADYVAPWCNLFCASLGLFVCALFAFLAAVYLLGETDEPTLRAPLRRQVGWTQAAIIGSGLLVFVAAGLDGLPLLPRFLHDPVSVACLVLATALPLPLGALVRRERVILARGLAAAQVVLILAGWFHLQYPWLIARRTEGAAGGLSYLQAAAPLATQKQLFYALIVGIMLIFPALYFLFRIFKTHSQAAPEAGMGLAGRDLTAADASQEHAAR